MVYLPVFRLRLRLACWQHFRHFLAQSFLCWCNQRFHNTSVHESRSRGKRKARQVVYRFIYPCSSCDCGSYDGSTFGVELFPWESSRLRPGNGTRLCSCPDVNALGALYYYSMCYTLCSLRPHRLSILHFLFRCIGIFLSMVLSCFLFMSHFRFLGFILLFLMSHSFFLLVPGGRRRLGFNPG